MHESLRLEKVLPSLPLPDSVMQRGGGCSVTICDTAYQNALDQLIGEHHDQHWNATGPFSGRTLNAQIFDYFAR